MPGSAMRCSSSASVMAAHALGVEAEERLPVALALAQDRDPGEPRLRALEAEQLEERAVVVQRDAPLVVVVGLVERIAARCPRAADRLRRPLVASPRRRLAARACETAAVAMQDPPQVQRGSRPFVVAAIVVGWLALGPRARRRRRHRPPAPDRRGDLAAPDRPRAARAARHADPGRRRSSCSRRCSSTRPRRCSASTPTGSTTCPRSCRPGTGSCTSPRCSSGARPPSRAVRSIPLVALAVATAWAVGGLLLPVAPGHARRRALRLVRRLRAARQTPGVYAAAFALTAALELYGTQPRHVGLGAARSDRAAERREPTERDPGRLLLARLLGARARALRHALLVRARRRLPVSDLLQRRHREPEAAELVVVVLG